VSGYRAIVIGASGAVGSALVRELLGSERCAGVAVITRRPVGLFGQNARLTQHVVEMDRLEAAVPALAAGCEAAFCTMGIGQPTKVPKEELWRVDVEYSSAFGRACRQAGVRHFSLLAAADADSKSRLYYLRVKGVIEERIESMNFQRASFFRPSLLQTKEIRYGLKDRILQTGFPLISWALPQRWHEIAVEDLARAMRVNAETPGEGSEILHYRDYVRLLNDSSC
jgi:uncharacterized protein YbjT (DUF2867 family)